MIQSQLSKLSELKNTQLLISISKEDQEKLIGGKKPKPGPTYPGPTNPPPPSSFAQVIK